MWLVFRRKCYGYRTLRHARFRVLCLGLDVDPVIIGVAGLVGVEASALYTVTTRAS
jgi:hypothetical protein